MIKRLTMLGLVVAGSALVGAKPDPLMDDYNRAWQLAGQLRYDVAVPLLKEIIGSDKTFYRAYRLLAEIYAGLNQSGSAEAYFRSLLAADSQNALPYYGLGWLYDIQSRPRDSLEAFQRCVRTKPQSYGCYLPLMQLSKDQEEARERIPIRRLSQPYRLLALALVDQKGGKFSASNQTALRGLEMAYEPSDTDVRASFEDVLVANDGVLGHFQDRLRHAKEAVRLSEALGSWEDLFRRSETLAGVYEAADQPALSMALVQDKLALARQLGHRGKEADELLVLARLFTLHGDRDAALDSYRDAQHIFESAGRPLNALNALLKIGELKQEAGDFRGAISSLEECRVASIQHGFKWTEAFAMKGLANAHRELGDYFEALALQSDAIRIFEELGYKLNVGATIRDSGAVYAAMGSYPEARSRYATSLQQARGSFDIEGQLRNLLNLADVALKEGKPADVVRYLREEFTLGARINYAPFRCRALLKTGVARLLLGEPEHALTDLAEALKIARTLQLKPEEAGALAAQGRCRLRLSDLPAARRQFSASLVLAEQIGLVQVILESRRGLAETHRAAGENEQARRELTLAVEEIESSRSRIPSPELRAGFVEENWKVYEELIDVLSVLGKQGHPGQNDRLAFEYAERARARSFLELLAESKARITRALTSEQIARQDQLFARLSQSSAALLRQPSTENRRVVERAERDLTDWTLELRRSNPEYKAIHYSEPYRVEQAQHAADQAGVILLEYCLGDHRSFVWVVGPGLLRMAVLPGRGEIERQVRLLRAFITRRPSASSDFEAYRRAASALYTTLIEPVRPWLLKSGNVVIIPDGILHYLPFETLVEQDTEKPRYFVESHPTVYAPSASVFGSLTGTMDRTQDKRSYDLLAYGDPVYSIEPSAPGISRMAEVVRATYLGVGIRFPPLPNTRREIESISQTVSLDKQRLYLGLNATEESVKHEVLSSYRILHFATHAILDERSPAMSGVVFSLANIGKEDGILRANEIFNLHLNADLVVLSACQTGLGRVVKGEGVIGLTRAFLYAGAHRVVVSLWEVNDLATADFMGTFYRQMQNGMTPALALRAAKLAMLHSDSPAYRHPYFWAPFVTVGEL